MVTNGAQNIPTGASGTILTGQGVGTAPVWTTNTYPATDTAGDLHYASATNVISGLAIGTTGQLLAVVSGLPAWANTFKGSTSGSGPAAGFIGEQIRGAATSVSSPGSTQLFNISNIVLTAGVWDISGVSSAASSNGSMVVHILGISANTASFTGCVAGDSQVTMQTSSVTQLGIGIPAFRVNTSSGATYYLVARIDFGSGTASASGRISATRVG